MAFAFDKSTPATGSAAIFNLKTLFKLQGWTVPSSSDGSTYNSSGDQITLATAGAGGMANTSAWFRLKAPAGTDEWVFQRGTTNLAWRVKASTTAFSSGAPSATQVPAPVLAADQVLLSGAGTDAAPTYHPLFTTDGLYRWNVAADSASPYGWWAGAFPTGGGNPSTLLVWDPLTATEPTDGYKYWLQWNHNSGAGGVAKLTVENYNGPTASFTDYGLSRGQVGTLSPSATPTVWCYAGAVGLFTDVNSSNFLAVPGGMGTNPISSKDESIPLVLLRRAAVPSPFGPGWKGVTTLLRWQGGVRSTGSTFTVSTTRDRIVYKDVHLPWDGSVPSV